jgi:hypothetical protein
MRLPLLAPADLNPEQQALHADMRQGIAATLNAFNIPVPERE